jgi:hypothetical protein
MWCIGWTSPRPSGGSAADRDREQKLLAEVSDMFVRRGQSLDMLPIINVYSARERLGAEIAMAPYRSCAPPSTI